MTDTEQEQKKIAELLKHSLPRVDREPSRDHGDHHDRERELVEPNH